MTTVEILLKPHIESIGAHTERFDAWLVDDLLCTSRFGWYVPARKLLERGYAPDDLLLVRHDGEAADPTKVPQPIGDLARWTIKESDRDGLGRARWLPFPSGRPQDGQEGAGTVDGAAVAPSSAGASTSHQESP